VREDVVKELQEKSKQMLPHERFLILSMDEMKGITRKANFFFYAVRVRLRTQLISKKRNLFA